MSMHVVVARFGSYDAARDAVKDVKQAGIKLADQAVVTNKGDGKFDFKEGKDAGGGKGFVYGAVTVAAAGLLLGPVGWGALAAGGVAGGLVSKVHDANIPNNRMEDVGRELKVGEGAAIAVANEGDQDQVTSIFEKAGGKVEAVGITDDLKQSLENLAPAGVEVDDDGTVSAAS